VIASLKAATGPIFSRMRPMHQGIGESTLASSVLAEDRNTPVVLGEIQRQIEACPAEPAYMKLSKSNHSSGASTSGTALFARATAPVRSVAREFSSAFWKACRLQTIRAQRSVYVRRCSHLLGGKQTLRNMGLLGRGGGAQRPAPETRLSRPKRQKLPVRDWGAPA
jgi:hypothetical protein